MVKQRINFDDLTAEDQERVLAQGAAEWGKDKAKANARRDEGLAFKLQKMELNDELKQYGEFTFNNYTESIKLFTEDKGFNSALAFRFAYMCTFSDYNGKLFYGRKYKGTYTDRMTLEDIVEVLGFSNNKARDCRDKLIELKAILIDDDGLPVINPKYNGRGNTTLGKDGKKDCVRAFDKAIKDLYKNAKTPEHKYIGNVIMLLPYVNVYHNVLCANPEEIDPRNVIVLTIEDICGVFNNSVKNRRRVEGNLIRATVNKEGLVGKWRWYGGDCYTINPRLFYKGSHLESLRAVMNLFKMGADIDKIIKKAV